MKYIKGEDYKVSEITVNMSGIVKGIKEWYEAIKDNPEARKIATDYLKPYWDMIDWKDRESINRGLNTMIYQIASDIFCFDNDSLEIFPIFDLSDDKVPSLSYEDEEKIKINISGIPYLNGYTYGDYSDDYNHAEIEKIFVALFRTISLKTLRKLIADNVNKDFKISIKADEIAFPTLEKLQDKKGNVNIGDAWIYEPYEFANHHQYDGWLKLIPEELVKSVLVFSAENEDPDEVSEEYRAHIALGIDDTHVLHQQVDEWYHDDPDTAISEILGCGSSWDWCEIDHQTYLLAWA